MWRKDLATEKEWIVDTTETRVDKIIEKMKELLPEAARIGNITLNLPDDSKVFLLKNGYISFLWKPLRFVHGKTEKRRIIATEVRDAIEWED